MTKQKILAKTSSVKKKSSVTQKSVLISILTSVYSLNLNNNLIKILNLNVAVNKDSVSFIQYIVFHTVYLNEKLMNENLNVFKLNEKKKSFM